MKTPVETQPILLGILEAAALARVSRSFLYERLAEGSIESRKAGRRRLVIAASLNQWMTNCMRMTNYTVRECGVGF